MYGKAYRFRLIAGSIIFGIVTFGDMLYNKGNWNIWPVMDCIWKRSFWCFLSSFIFILYDGDQEK